MLQSYLCNMAHRITYKPQGRLISSAVGELTVAVDGDSVDVTLTAPGGIVILSERYYPYGGYVTLYDLGSLIEAEMRTSGLSTADFTLRVFSDTQNNKADSCVLHILYCDRFTVCTDIPAFLRENFLTTLSMRRVAPGSTLSLFFYTEQGESIAYNVAHSFRKGGSDSIFQHTFIVDSGKTATSSGVVQINIALSSVIADAASFATARLGDIMLVSFTVRCGQRSISCFVDYSLDDRETFFFRNCFNVFDFATLPVLTTAKTDVDRSLAVINGKSQFYNQSTAKTYEVEATRLTSDEAGWIDQLFSSYDVFRIEPDATNPDEPLVLAPVLITDCTCEIHDGDEKLNTVKFTWRHTDNRPIVRMSASPGIFTSPYNIVYS